MNDFDRWNKIKKITNKERIKLYTVREIWWCRMGINIGTEQNGKGNWYARPCVILKDFGPYGCLIIPLTKSPRKNKMRIDVGIIENHRAKANSSQIRTIDTRRLESKIGFLEKEKFLKIVKAVKELL